MKEFKLFDPVNTEESNIKEYIIDPFCVEYCGYKTYIRKLNILGTEIIIPNRSVFTIYLNSIGIIEVLDNDLLNCILETGLVEYDNNKYDSYTISIINKDARIIDLDEKEFSDFLKVFNNSEKADTFSIGCSTGLEINISNKKIDEYICTVDFEWDKGNKKLTHSKYII